jgi:hypothetical protein
MYLWSRWDLTETTALRRRIDMNMKTYVTIGILLMPNLSFAQSQSNLLFNAFKQGIVESDAKKAGNCASVAIIKAAIGTFGVAKVFEIKKSEKTNAVKLKDGATFEISDTEIEYAKNKSKFIPGDTTKTEIKQIFEYARLCFAILCKSYQIQSYKGKPFEFVVDKLNEGYTTSDIHGLLGLNKKLIGNNPSYELLKSYKNLVLWNSAHAVYYSEGFYDEAFDKNAPIEKIENLKDHHCSVGGWLKNGCKPRNAYLLIE